MSAHLSRYLKDFLLWSYTEQRVNYLLPHEFDDLKLNKKKKMIYFIFDLV
jgi:hypothetical protein